MAQITTTGSRYGKQMTHHNKDSNPTKDSKHLKAVFPFYAHWKRQKNLSSFNVFRLYKKGKLGWNSLNPYSAELTCVVLITTASRCHNNHNTTTLLRNKLLQIFQNLSIHKKGYVKPGWWNRCNYSLKFWTKNSKRYYLLW